MVSTQSTTVLHPGAEDAARKFHPSGWPLFSEGPPSWLEVRLHRTPCPEAYRSWLFRR